MYFLGIDTIVHENASFLEVYHVIYTYERHRIKGSRFMCVMVTNRQQVNACICPGLKL
jgi:hypothetical protein